MARKAFLEIHIMCQLHPFDDREALQTIIHAISHLAYGLLQHVLHKAALEAAGNPECSSMGNKKTCSLRVALAASWLPNVIQVLVTTQKVLYGIDSDYLGHYLFQ